MDMQTNLRIEPEFSKQLEYAMDAVWEELKILHMKDHAVFEVVLQDVRSVLRRLEHKLAIERDNITVNLLLRSDRSSYSQQFEHAMTTVCAELIKVADEQNYTVFETVLFDIRSILEALENRIYSQKHDK